MPELGVSKHSYLFCQYYNPERSHEGDRCDCFDTPSQRRTAIAKRRLARLRTDRKPEPASTSTQQESAVTSDPAVTGGIGPWVLHCYEKTCDWPSLEEWTLGRWDQSNVKDPVATGPRGSRW